MLFRSFPCRGPIIAIVDFTVLTACLQLQYQPGSSVPPHRRLVGTVAEPGYDALPALGANLHVLPLTHAQVHLVGQVELAKSHVILGKERQV